MCPSMSLVVSCHVGGERHEGVVEGGLVVQGGVHVRVGVQEEAQVAGRMVDDVLEVEAVGDGVGSVGSLSDIGVAEGRGAKVSAGVGGDGPCDDEGVGLGVVAP